MKHYNFNLIELCETALNNTNIDFSYKVSFLSNILENNYDMRLLSVKIWSTHNISYNRIRCAIDENKKFLFKIDLKPILVEKKFTTDYTNYYNMTLAELMIDELKLSEIYIQRLLYELLLSKR